MADILDEIDQSIREENFHKLLRKLLPYFVLAIFSIIAASGIYVWWSNKKIAESQYYGDKLVTLVEKLNENSPDTKELLDELMGSHDGDIPALAALLRAELDIEHKDEAKAAEILAEYSKKADDLIVKDLLKILEINLTLDDVSKSEVTLGNIQYLVSSNSPFKGSALILNALFYLRDKNVTEANKILTQIEQDPELPKIIKDRARVLTSVSKE